MTERVVELNVLRKEETEKRIAPVFKAMADVIGRSVGAYGSPTIISIYPETHSTKDGFTIMKYTNPKNQLDREIFGMAFAVCERLNNLVGDGTTTSILATNAIYEAYLERKSTFDELMVSSKDIMDAFERVKDKVLNVLRTKAVKINTLPKEEMLDYIKKVVTISSNDDKDVIDNITSLYSELGYPAIDISLSVDGKTKAYCVDGFSCNVHLNDAIYLNNDDKTAIEKDIDVLIFDHKVIMSTYDNIIKPIANECRLRKRKLVVIAPFYDSIAIKQKIANELNMEFEKMKSITTILTTCASATSFDKTALSDLAMLMNTSIITRELEDELIEKGERFAMGALVRIDKRQLELTSSVLIVKDAERGDGYIKPYSLVTPEEQDMIYGVSDELSVMTLGHCSNAILTMNKSTFKGFNYNQARYAASLNAAKIALEEAENKYKEMGTFNLEITQAQNRLHSLGLKVGKIEVGAETSMKQKFLKDVYDDAVKGAASAFDNGIVLGCNVSLVNSIYDVHTETSDELEITICEILEVGFKSVYARVIQNMLGENRKDITVNNPYTKHLNLNEEFDADDNSLLVDHIINRSIDNEIVYDLREKKFSSDIINSLDTDVQVMNATIGLLSMLIAGNQFISTTL